MSEKPLNLTLSDRNWLAAQIRDPARKAQDDKKRFAESMIRIMERSQAEATAQLNAILDEILDSSIEVRLMTDSGICLSEPCEGIILEGCPKFYEALKNRMAERASPNPLTEQPESGD